MCPGATLGSCPLEDFPIHSCPVGPKPPKGEKPQDLPENQEEAEEAGDLPCSPEGRKGELQGDLGLENFLLTLRWLQKISSL